MEPRGDRPSVGMSGDCAASASRAGGLRGARRGWPASRPSRAGCLLGARQGCCSTPPAAASRQSDSPSLGHCAPVLWRLRPCVRAADGPARCSRAADPLHRPHGPGCRLLGERRPAGPAESDQAGGKMGACRAGDSGVTPGVYNVERRILTVGHYQVLETLYRHGRSWMGRSIYSLQLISFPDKAAQQHSNRDPGGPAPAQRRHRRCRAQILRVRSRRRHRRRCCRPVGAAAGPFAGGPGCSSRSLRGPFALPVDWRHGSVRSGLAPLRRGSFGMQEISA